MTKMRHNLLGLTREEYNQIHYALIARRSLLAEILPRPIELDIVQKLLIDFDVASALTEQMDDNDASNDS